MSEKKVIIVTRQETVARSWARDASTFVLCASLIGLGVLLDSAAMQWLGAVLAFIAILMRSSGLMARNTFDIKGAQKRLDEIREEQSK